MEAMHQLPVHPYHSHQRFDQRVGDGCTRRSSSHRQRLRQGNEGHCHYQDRHRYRHGICRSGKEQEEQKVEVVMVVNDEEGRCDHHHYHQQQQEHVHYQHHQQDEQLQDHHYNNEQQHPHQRQQDSRQDLQQQQQQFHQPHPCRSSQPSTLPFPLSSLINVFASSPQEERQQQQQEQQHSHQQQQQVAAQHYHAPHAALASLAYRPLHLSLHTSPPTDHQQKHQQRAHPHSCPNVKHQSQTLSHLQSDLLQLIRYCDSTSVPLPAAADDAAAVHDNTPHHRLSLQHPPPPSQPPLLSSPPMAYPSASEDELAEMQKLSNEYESEVKGPLVGQLQPSTDITNEYASADPVYQAKTTALPQTYSHYRTIRGDGKCGWRAVAFGYFEALVRNGDEQKFRFEEARLRSLSNIIAQSGFDPDLFDDFADVTFGLLRSLVEVLHDDDVEQTLLDAFNKDDSQNYIITHFRTLTASWMKTHVANYDPWMEGQTVYEFCDNVIQPVGAEMVHVGLSALNDVLLSPAGIALEVLYLDRSEGVKVNMHRFDSDHSSAFTFASLRLLYRPGHYDLLYKPEEVPHKRIHLQFDSQPYREPASSLGMSSLMSGIPGMSIVNPHPGWVSSTFMTDSDFFPIATSVQSCADHVPIPMSPTSQPLIQPRSMYVPTTTTTTTTSTHLPPPPTHIPAELPTHPSMPTELSPQSLSQAALPPSKPSHQLGGNNFRPSIWQWETNLGQITSQMPLQTAIFRK